MNVIATYGRNLFALACGLFSGRWALMALGHVDYGLFGVVGGLTAFIAFFNNVLAYSVGRFYATAIGASNRAQTDGVGREAALEECRRWFSIAVMVHTALSTVLIVVGYPIGEWAIRCFLSIPPDRVAACVWVFRFVCVSCFVAMVSVPYSAMYTAKQYIAELTVYSVATTALNVGMLYYMVTHPGVWLAKFAFWICCLQVAPQVIIAVRGVFIFPECRFRWAYCREMNHLKRLFSYSGWQIFGTLGCLARFQGIQVLVNKYYGPVVNSAMAVANTVNGHTQSLSSSLISAFQPAIATAFGAGEMDRMRSLSYRACKFCMLFTLVFTLPLSVELPEVMELWLVNPPRYAVEFCWCVMAVAFINISAIGHDLAVNAGGRVALYQIVVGGSVIVTLPLAWLFCALGLGPIWIGVALVLMMAVTLVRVFFARALLGMSVGHWLYRIVLPVLAVVMVCGGAGMVCRTLLPPCFVRIVVTSALVDGLLAVLTWFFVLDGDERGVTRGAVARALAKLKPKADGVA